MKTVFKHIRCLSGIYEYHSDLDGSVGVCIRLRVIGLRLYGPPAGRHWVKTRDGVDEIILYYDNTKIFACSFVNGPYVKSCKLSSKCDSTDPRYKIVLDFIQSSDDAE